MNRIGADTESNGKLRLKYVIISVHMEVGEHISISVKHWNVHTPHPKTFNAAGNMYFDFENTGTYSSNIQTIPGQEFTSVLKRDTLCGFGEDVPRSSQT